jgi:hypothetical protein
MLLREWAAMKYPAVNLFANIKLGPTQAHLVGVKVHPSFERALQVEMWYADGMIDLPSEVLIIESKMQASPQAVGQVKFYCRQVIRTPRFAPLLVKPIVPVVLFAEDDYDVTQFCRTEGVRVELYTPAWIEDYLSQVQFAQRGATPPQPMAELLRHGHAQNPQ